MIVRGVLRQGGAARGTRFRRGRAVLAFLLIGGTVTVATALWPRTYRSEAKLLVRLGRENATLDPTATFGKEPIVAVPSVRESEINSVVEIVTTRALIEKVVDAIGPGAILDGRCEAAAAGSPTAGESSPSAAAVV